MKIVRNNSLRTYCVKGGEILPLRTIVLNDDYADFLVMLSAGELSIDGEIVEIKKEEIKEVVSVVNDQNKKGSKKK